MSAEHQKARELFEDVRKLWSPDKPDSQANCLHRLVRPVRSLVIKTIDGKETRYDQDYTVGWKIGRRVEGPDGVRTILNIVDKPDCRWVVLGHVPNNPGQK